MGFFPYDNSGKYLPRILLPNPLNRNLGWICSACGHAPPAPTNPHQSRNVLGSWDYSWKQLSHLRSQVSPKSGSSGEFQLGGDCEWFFPSDCVCENVEVSFSHYQPSKAFQRTNKPEKNFSSLTPVKTLGNHPPIKKHPWLILFVCFVLGKPAIKYHPNYASHFCCTCLSKHCLFHLSLWSLTSQDWILRFSVLKLWKQLMSQAGTCHNPCVPFGDYQLTIVTMTKKEPSDARQTDYLPKCPTDIPAEGQRGILISQRNQSITLTKYRVMCDSEENKSR